MRERDAGLLAVGAVGAALIVLFAGAGVILAVGHVVPTEFWAAASSLSGALVGLLAPQPATKGALTRRAGQYQAMAADALAADPADRKSASLTKASAAAMTAAQDTSTKSYDLRIVLLSVVGIGAFVVGIVLALSVGKHTANATTSYDTAVKNAADTLIALGAGAAGAVIGLLAPSPHRPAG